MIATLIWSDDVLKEIVVDVSWDGIEDKELSDDLEAIWCGCAAKICCQNMWARVTTFQVCLIMEHCCIEAGSRARHSLFQYPFGISPVSMPWGRHASSMRPFVQWIQNLALKKKAIPVFSPYSHHAVCSSRLGIWPRLHRTWTGIIILIRAFTTYFAYNSKYFLNRDMLLMSIFVISCKRWSWMFLARKEWDSCIYFFWLQRLLTLFWR